MNGLGTTPGNPFTPGLYRVVADAPYYPGMKGDLVDVRSTLVDGDGDVTKRNGGYVRASDLAPVTNQLDEQRAEAAYFAALPPEAREHQARLDRADDTDTDTEVIPPIITETGPVSV